MQNVADDDFVIKENDYLNFSEKGNSYICWRLFILFGIISFPDNSVNSFYLLSCKFYNVNTITSFNANVPLLYPLKMSENQSFFTFSGGIAMERLREMSLSRKAFLCEQKIIFLYHSRYDSSKLWSLYLNI